FDMPHDAYLNAGLITTTKRQARYIMISGEVLSYQFTSKITFLTKMFFRRSFVQSSEKHWLFWRTQIMTILIIIKY
ncbi:hypothetical protein OQE62_19335, partial [Microbulbifer halophilus]|uniref:hypothetical protein n=1 Tax=Microbulbifer halophilus TaxID=453963 RepID=UPI0022437B3B